jgi:hypothetical protein
VFLVYRTGLLPDARRTAETWRKAAIEAGLPDLYLVRVASWGDTTDPESIGFDAAVEFAPAFDRLRQPWWRRGVRLQQRLERWGLPTTPFFTDNVYRYETLIERHLREPRVAYTRFRCLTPGWDNSARREHGATLFHGATPDLYERWLRAVIAETKMRPIPERLLFINAWNEWAEGNHLEPDQRWGHAFLEATARALSS